MSPMTMLLSYNAKRGEYLIYFWEFSIVFVRNRGRDLLGSYIIGLEVNMGT